MQAIAVGIETAFELLRGVSNVCAITVLSAFRKDNRLLRFLFASCAAVAIQRHVASRRIRGQSSKNHNSPSLSSDGAEACGRWIMSRLNHVSMRTFLGLFALTSLFVVLLGSVEASASECDGLSVSGGEVIWCDSFEDSDLPPSGNIADSYFDYSPANGNQSRSQAESYDGSYSLRHHWQVGAQDAGSLFRTFGRSPVSSKSHSDRDFKEIYWRMFVKYPQGTTVFPNKLTRATIFSRSNWAQAMIGHVWLNGTGSQYLAIDPASGVTTSGALATTQWNDLGNLRWLGLRQAAEPIATGRWQCIEAHIALNTAGNNDGEFDLWIDDNLAAQRHDLNWVETYNEYGINAVMLSSYWNGLAPVQLDRYIDAFVIATARIGCSSVVRPLPPRDFSAD